MNINTIQSRFGFTDRHALHNAVLAAYPMIDESSIDLAVWEYCKQENDRCYPDIAFTGV